MYLWFNLFPITNECILHPVSELGSGGVDPASNKKEDLILYVIDIIIGMLIIV